MDSIRLPVMVILALACGGSRTPTPLACAPVEGPVDPSAATDALLGEFQITLVATFGKRQGARLQGSMTLTNHEPSMRHYIRSNGSVDPSLKMPFYGTLDAALDSVGAVTPGDLSSTDPFRPGVSVVETRGGEGDGGLESVFLRLGSLANIRGVELFDGGFTALEVQELKPGGDFFGHWRSGVNGIDAEGYFCAIKKAPELP